MSDKRIAFLGGKNKSGPIYDGCADVYDYLNNKWLRPIEVFGENVIVDARRATRKQTSGRFVSWRETET